MTPAEREALAWVLDADMQATGWYGLSDPVKAILIEARGQFEFMIWDSIHLEQIRKNIILYLLK